MGNPWDVFTLYDTNNDICGYSIESFGSDPPTTGFPPLETPLDPEVTNALTVFTDFLKSQILSETPSLSRLGGVVVNGNVFFTDSRTITECTASSVIESSGTVLVPSSDNYIALDQSGVLDVLSAISVHIQSCYAWAKNILDLVDAAQTVEDIRNIDYETGKPVMWSGQIPSGPLL